MKVTKKPVVIEYTIELTEEDYEQLLLALEFGFAYKGEHPEEYRNTKFLSLITQLENAR